MPLSANSLVEVSVRQSCRGKQFVNIFYYRQVESNIDIPLGDLMSKFMTEVIERWRNVASTQVSFVDMTWTNLHNNETNTAIINLNGTRTGEVLPLHNAWGFTLKRLSRDTRQGSKRFGGISEADVSDTLATSGMQTALADLGGALAMILESGFPLFRTLEPVIYSKPTTFLTTYLYSGIAEGQYRRVTTQNSRKVL